MNPARSVALPSGDTVAALGQGTWYLGESPGRRADEVASIRLGIDLGMTLIDTAEMYGNGAAEALVGEAIAGRRDDEMIELSGIPGGDGVQTDQILYNPTRRGPEYALLPWLTQAGIPTMAYSPIEQGRLLEHPALQPIAKRHNVSAAQVTLAWALRHDGVIAIPRAGTPSHVREDAAARDIELTRDDLLALDRAFPPPTRPRPPEVL